MPLTVEDGTGIAGADSYASRDAITAYWDDRPHDELSTTWSGATDEKKDGAAREATSYLDSVYNRHYRGMRAGRVQGLLWPRTYALDEADYPLPDLPGELTVAVSELAARAVGQRLSPDAGVDSSVKRLKEKVGPLETETEYFSGSLERKHGFIEDLLAPILRSTESPGSPSWNWR